MIVRVLLAALAAGLLAGLLYSPVQAVKTVPIIKAAEAYEVGIAAPAAHLHEDDEAHAAVQQPAAAPAGASHDQPAMAHDQSADAGEEPLLLGRFWNTLAANLVLGAGYGLLLAAVSLFAGVNITFATGILWGAAGWLAVQLLPSLGLPPEVPGFPYVDVDARKYWWMATVALSAFGLVLIFLKRSPFARTAGVVALFAPHIWGAPQPEVLTSPVPAYLASQYAAASLATMLFFWLVLGLALGWFMDRAKLSEE